MKKNSIINLIFSSTAAVYNQETRKLVKMTASKQQVLMQEQNLNVKN